MKKIEIIDYLKGYSIFTIVLFHLLSSLKLQPILDKAVSFGGTGVHLFILLSGFGMFLSFEKKPIGYSPFIKRRFGKVYIPYIIIVIISALIALVVPVYEGSLYALGGHIFLYKMFDNDIISSYGYQLWFISTIIQFYFVFHLLVLLKKNVSERAFLLIGLFVSLSWSVVCVLFGKEELRTWNSFFLQYIWEFMLGMLIASRVNSNTLIVKLKEIYWLLLGITGLVLYGALAIAGGKTGKMFNDIPALIGYSAIAIFLFKLKIKPVNKFFAYTGEISYSLYLIHILVLLFVRYFLERLDIWNPIVYVGLVLVISYLLAHWYNKFLSLVYKRINI